MEDLIVDFDGKVLTCCHDFSRRNEIGDLRLEEVSALMANDARREVYDALGQQEWNRFESCRDCLVSDVPLMQAALAEAAE